MGTPEFAVPSLQILHETGYEVAAVVTAPDKPAGRGLALRTSPVKDYAVAHGIPVLQPPKLKAPEFLEALRGYKANLQVVVAFRMLPEVVWNMPELGTFNLHASLLPNYRGAAPINWAIINGETETGVTTFFMKHEIDTGDLLLQESEPILPHDTAGSLYERLMQKGARLVLKTVQAIEAGDDQPTAQDLSAPSHKAPKIFKEDCEIDLSKTRQQVYDFVRGMAPYPAAWTTLKGKNCKIFDAKPVETPPEGGQEHGHFVTDGKKWLHLKVADGQVAIHSLQLAGKKRMDVEVFLRGMNF